MCDVCVPTAMALCSMHCGWRMIGKAARLCMVRKCVARWRRDTEGPSWRAGGRGEKRAGSADMARRAVGGPEGAACAVRAAHAKEAR